MDKDLKELQDETKARTEVVEVIKSKTADVTLKNVAKIKARFEAYNQVYDNYEFFIIDQSKKLKTGEYSAIPYKELGVARLIATWIFESEKYLEANEKFLQEVEKQTRKGFVSEALSTLPDDLKQKLLQKLEEEKHKLLEWFAKEVQLAYQKARKRDEK